MSEKSKTRKLLKSIRRYDIGYSGYEDFNYISLFHFKNFTQKKFNEMVYDAYYDVLSVEFLEKASPFYNFSYLYDEVAKKLIEKHGFFMFEEKTATFFGSDMMENEDEKLKELLGFRLDGYDLHLRKNSKHPIQNLILFLKENTKKSGEIASLLEKFFLEEEMDHYFVFPRNIRVASKRNKSQVGKYKNILKKSIEDTKDSKRKILDIEIEITGREYLLGFDYEHGWLY